MLEGIRLEFESDILSVDDAKTTELQGQDKYVNFLAWLKSNGISFENVSYPVVFGKHSITGTIALEDMEKGTKFV